MSFLNYQNTDMQAETEAGRTNRLSTYYRVHSNIYDATRWLFLFGRGSTIKLLPTFDNPPKILEVGCGTGNNLIQLHKKYPEARLTGIDLSQEMLTKAQKKIQASDNPQKFRLIHDAYGSSCLKDSTFDVILFSYSLTMMTQHIELIFSRIYQNLDPEGLLAVTDFHQTKFGWFEQWMRMNHVVMDGSLYKTLSEAFKSTHSNILPAYFNWWEYFIFIGRKEL